MTHVLVRHAVEDYDAWKQGFDDNEALRKQNGGQGGHVYQDVNDPNQVTLLLEWSNEEDARSFMESTELKQAMEQAGVQGRPDVHVLEHADDIPV